VVYFVMGACLLLLFEFNFSVLSQEIGWYKRLGNGLFCVGWVFLYNDWWWWDACFQGIVLSAFFWGYATTQVIGGYLSDRCGAKTVMIAAMTGWSALTLMTPIMTQTCCDGLRSGILHMFVIMRILTGCVQGTHLCCQSSHIQLFYCLRRFLLADGAK